MKKCLITFILCYRVRTEKNIHSLPKLLNSIVKYFNTEEVELLIKIDNDDIKAQELVKKLKYPFPIKLFRFNRWEGRWSMNHIYNFFMAEKNIDSKFFSLLNDDMYFARSMKEDIYDVLDENEGNLDNIYRILGNFQTPMNIKKLLKIEDYKNKSWLNSDYICSYPIVSTKIVEVTGNFGYQPNVDSHFALLNLIMFRKYGMNLARHLIQYTYRENIENTDEYGKGFNQNNMIDGNTISKNEHFYKLMEQQAHNLYLNIHEMGVPKNYIVT